MQIAIVQFPGSNCERETKMAVECAGMSAIDWLWNDDPTRLASFDGYVLVGGFSYEDRSRAGVIAACHPAMATLKEQANLGKPVLGICNGAQIIVEAGLIPGVALTNNKRIKDGQILGTGYYNAWVNLRVGSNTINNAFTRRLTADACIEVPVAHAEGRFCLAQDSAEQIQQQGTILFQYCTSNGELDDQFPVNPNGSTYNIAALSNTAGNIMAMMPHPERTPQGDAIFLSMRDYIEEGNYTCASRVSNVGMGSRLRGNDNSLNFRQDDQLLIESIITDNQAFTVERTLQQLGISARIRRQTHWQISCQSPSIRHQIESTGVLYNENKERPVKHSSHPQTRSFLVRAKEDLHGLHVKQRLIKHYALNGIHAIKHGVVWQIQALQGDVDQVCEQILKTGILFNSITQECYRYD